MAINLSLNMLPSQSSPYVNKICVFLVVKGPAADATEAPQPSGLLCNPVMMIISFFVFTCNGAPVE